MHWILFIGLNMSLSTTMGAFVSEQECNEAADKYLDLMNKIGAAASCMRDDDPVVILLKNKAR